LKLPNLQATPKAGNPQSLQVICVCLFLALAVLAVFGQNARFGFVDYDDPKYVCGNSVVQQGLTWKGVLWAVSYGQIGHWHPLTWLSHMADCQMFGLWAGGHHLTNVALHGAGTVLLFLLLRKMTGALWRSAFVAAVFAVHPLRAESVAWVSERKDVLSGVFFMLTLWAYVDYVRQPSRGRYAAVAVLYGLGLLSKNMLVTLPFVLLLLDWWPLGRMTGIENSELRIENSEGAGQGPRSLAFWGLVKEKIPFFLMSVGSCVATALAPEKPAEFERVPVLERVANAVVSCVIYIRQMFFPAGLAVPYPNPPHGQPLWKAGLALVLLAAISAWVLWWRNKRPFLLAGWLWYLGMLVPVLGLVQISNYSHADRYTYLPGIGLVMAVTWALADWSAGWKHQRAVLGCLMSASVGVLMLCCHRQTSFWRDSQSLWSRALACDPDNPIALNNMGNVLVNQGELDQAMPLFQQSIELDPANADARNNFGNALATQGADDAAIAQFQKALELEPDLAAAHYDLAYVLVKHGRLDEAIAHYRRAVELMPDSELAHNNLGQALLLKGDLDGAMASLQKAAALNSDPLARWSNLASQFMQKGDWRPAILFFRQAININPRLADTWAGLGTACVKDGQFKEAIDSWQKALEINPGHLQALNNLAWLLATASDPSLRDPAKAMTLAAKAGQLSGGVNPAILHTLAAAYAAQGNYGTAAATARRALELATAQKNDPLAGALRQEIKLYEANTPPANASP
jgi:tetratricopeptide (TPR) repeat protein